MVALIIIAVVAVLVLLRARANDPHRPAGARRRHRAARPVPPHAESWPRDRRPVRRPAPAADRPARASRFVPAAARDHRGQPRRQHRHGHLLPGQRSEAATYEIAELHPGDRAAHGDDAAQRHRRSGAREHAHLARRDQRAVARRARRGDGQVGHPREPRRAEGDRPARLDQGLDGEADARRPRQARADPAGRGAEAVRRSSPPRASSRPPCCAPGQQRQRSSRPRDRRRRSTPSSRRSTRATPIRSSSPTSTCRRFRSSRRASRTRCRSSPPSSAGARQHRRDGRKDEG